MKILTTYDPKPIPDRQFDWSAIDEETYDGAEDSKTRFEIGYGKTERSAVEDLLDRIDERDVSAGDPAFDFKVRELRGVEENV
jgi:hypothetical protein